MQMPHHGSLNNALLLVKSASKSVAQEEAPLGSTRGGPLLSNATLAVETLLACAGKQWPLDASASTDAHLRWIPRERLCRSCAIWGYNMFCIGVGSP